MLRGPDSDAKDGGGEEECGNKSLEVEAVACGCGVAYSCDTGGKAGGGGGSVAYLSHHRGLVALIRRVHIAKPEFCVIFQFGVSGHVVGIL